MRRGRALAAAAAALPAPADGAVVADRSSTSTPIADTLATISGAATASFASTSTGRILSTLSPEAPAVSMADVELPAPDKRRRIPIESAPSATAAPELETSASRHADASSQPVVPVRQPAGMPSLLKLVERFKLVFLSGGDGPVATADGGVASEATFELVLAVRDAINALWEAHEQEIKRHCAPAMPKGLIAKQEVFGFALADALGRPVLPGDRAMKVGQNGDNAVRAAEGSKDRKGKVTAAREAAREAVRKARRAADKDPTLEQGVAEAELNGRKVVEAVLRSRVDLKLPNETVGAKRKCMVESVPTASPAWPPTAAERAAETLANRRLGVQTAMAALDAAEEARAANHAQVARLQRTLDELGPWPDHERWIDSWESRHPLKVYSECDAYYDRARTAFDAIEAPFLKARSALWDAQLVEAESDAAIKAAHLAICRARLDVTHAEIAFDEEDVALTERIWRVFAGEESAEEAPWHVWDVATAARAEEEMRRSSGSVGSRVTGAI